MLEGVFMSSTIGPFWQARSKIERAYKHIDEVTFHWEAYLKTDFCKMVIEDNPDGGGDAFIRIESVAPPPGQLSIVIGDALHNARAALDYTISEILGWKSTRLAFPMYQTREELERSFAPAEGDVCPECGRGAKGGRNTPIEDALPGLGAYIAEMIRPYDGGSNALRVRNKLDNKDKHRLLVPIVIPTALRNAVVTDGNNNRLTMSAEIDVGGMARMAQLSSGNLKVEHKGHIAAEILFNEPGIVEGSPVLPALIDMVKASSETVDSIAKFALATGWKPVL